ncbi:MAG TPA: adenosylhomocysteinase [Thermoleophilaceae bacterium]|nr:adenosylhomocysteinase [Thermoleophilaceae bacterium]
MPPRKRQNGSDIADPALAGAGSARIEWADGQMPVLRRIRERFAERRPLDGVRVGCCLHVTSETANLVRALSAGGAEVAISSANPLSTQDEVAAALVAEHSVAVHARRGEDRAGYEQHLDAVAATEPQITIDDGADLVLRLHESLDGAIEETTTGLVLIRRLEAEGKLGCPVLAVNEAWTERLFNDQYGTGQSALDGILRATNLLLAGRAVVVLGYGRTGRGIAQRAHGLGARVVVCEVDPTRALEASMEGFEVMTSLEAAERGEVFITVTGSRDVLRREHFERMRDGAVLANAGHFDVEISVADLRQAAGADGVEVLPLVEQYEVSGRRLNLLAQGRVVNLAAGRGHPAAVMDMSFANTALAVEHLVAGGLAPGVHAMPAGIDREVARLKLASLGIEIDALSGEQRDYMSAWSASPAGADEIPPVIRRFAESMGSGRLDADVIHPDLEMVNAKGWAIEGTYRGVEGARRWWQELEEAFSEFSVEMDEVVPLGDDRYLTTQRAVGVFRATGIRFEGPWASLLTVRDGRIVKAIGYLSRKRAERAFAEESESGSLPSDAA